ncbi:MAG TPA: YjgN family protein [Methylotenera sp.]|nr:YjgN family protein [Methylotenera sp.]
MENSNQTLTPIVFQGKASEYFGIWIVNLLLTLLTLGIYSAWAKVRRKKYFYNNTLIQNVGFDYHAKPTAILKGRIIAFVFFVGYSMSANVHPILPALFMLILFTALPWLVVRGSLFNAHNTSHRGLRFDFVGTLRGATRVYIVLPLVTLLTFGLGAPYAAHERKQFSVNNHKFGLSPFVMQPRVKEFYKVYLKLMLIPILIIAILAAIAIPAYQHYVKKAAAHATPGAASLVKIEPPPIKQAAEMPQPEAQIEQSAEETQAAPAAQEEAVAQEKTMEEMRQERERRKQDKMRDMFEHPGMLLYMVPVFALYALVIFSFYGYLQARIGNLVWNNTTLDKLSFKSSLRARDFIWLYFTNILAIMLTFGLATPWAQVRMAKYRISKLQIVGDVDFDRFIGDKKAEVKATGEELADMFDVDLSFG